jgi:hypothetical protein
MFRTKTNSRDALSWLTAVLVVGLFFGCQAQRSMHCESDVTGTTAHAECTATEAGELERP